MEAFCFLQALREETQNDWAGRNTNYRTPTYSAHARDEHMLAAVFLEAVVRNLYVPIVFLRGSLPKLSFVVPSHSHLEAVYAW